MSKKRSWIPIVLGVIFCVFLIAAALIGAGFYYFVNHVGVETVTAQTAHEEFEKERKAFGNQEPLLILEGHKVRVNAAEKARPNKSGKRIEDIHILAWDPDEDKLARIRIPFWLLAMKSGGRIRLNSGSRVFESDELPLEIEDLERHGPGLIIDVTDREGQRVLVWAQ